MLTNLGLDYPIKVLNPNSGEVGLSRSEGQSYTVLLNVYLVDFWSSFDKSHLLDNIKDKKELLLCSYLSLQFFNGSQEGFVSCQ